MVSNGIMNWRRIDVRKPDFDERFRLFREDPEEFERLRKRLVDEAIESVDEDRREGLRRFHWRIETEFRKHKSPIGAFIALQKMFFEQVYGKGGFHDALEVILGKKDARCLSSRKSESAVIIPFSDKGT